MLQFLVNTRQKSPFPVRRHRKIPGLLPSFPGSFSPSHKPFRMNTFISVHSKQVQLPQNQHLHKNPGGEGGLLLTRTLTKNFCPASIASKGPLLVPALPRFFVTSLFPPQTRSAMLPSMRWKKKRPPTRTSATAAVEANRSGPGGWPWPVSAQRKPSMTPAMGLRP